MEEKNLTEAQVAEQTTSQDVNYDENMSMTEKYFDILKKYELLKAQNTELIDKLAAAEKSLDWNRRSYIEYMNQRDILKKALEEVCKRQKVSKAEMYEVIMTANDIDLDTAIAKLGKNL